VKVEAVVDLARKAPAATDPAVEATKGWTVRRVQPDRGLRRAWLAWEGFNVGGGRSSKGRGC
jgi:hypothetical protein